ncbi:hypothetical protein B5807_06315 [Epicoccum nigrum]|uniref:Peptidase S9 prolyl oligopeptidase catalytic domain-containing protein n=1 Tax=Epicoccum nigrum TaxID=105696 RepID=A0A1Y2LVG3_EPING|nr:hypothetical protein B5807_06315 [Epicoccum nigrum]
MRVPSHCLSPVLLLFSRLCPSCHCSTTPPLEHKPLFSFSSTWEVLGPFQIGTREATWGADPLEFVGGFRSLEYDPEASFRSSLPVDGTARWNVTTAKTLDSEHSANSSLSIGYSNVDWEFLKLIYGWAAVQYQAWARGELIVGGNETQNVILHTDAILEFWVNDTHYFGGDFYSYRNAPPVLRLDPGHHRIDLRLARDVRAFGGILEPTIDVVVGVEKVSGDLDLAKPGILMSDVIDGNLATPQGSISLRNSGIHAVEIVGIQPANVSTNSTSYAIDGSRITIAAGQTRSVALNITLPSKNVSSIAYSIAYKVIGTGKSSSLEVTQDLNHVSTYDPHKITFTHPSGTISYAMLRPPARNASCSHKQVSLPVLLSLHGAGLEADHPEVAGAMDPVSDLCAWIVFPTGVTPWSGDDWHNWGFADIEAAINTIPSWISSGNWSGPGVDTDRWIVSGHSNGGQGTWYVATHRPDKVLAAIPVSGYASIQKYVPYELWQPSDPRRTSMVSAALNSYRHEMLMDNVRGIPIQVQHGEIDDNVPAYHSRLLALQLQFAGANSSYKEVPDQNHWWDGVMTTPELISFYYNQSRSTEELPRDLNEFSIVVGDPGDMGSKGGVKVTQLEDPGNYGRVHVRGKTVKTSNVLSIEFGPPFWKDAIVLDGQALELAAAKTTDKQHIRVRLSGRVWTVEDVEIEGESPNRRGRQLGSMTAILRTHGPMMIQHSGSANASRLALQVSRNLQQYFRADSTIASEDAKTESTNITGNIIHLVTGKAFSSTISDFPVQINPSGITIRDYRGQDQLYAEARGAAWLQPLEGERLKLVLWGADDEGLGQATRLIPMLTGVGQPDFVVLSEEAKWKGLEGTLALGFFDSQWQVAASSFVS